MAELNASWKRDFDVYDRLRELGVDLGKKEEVVPPPGVQRIAQVTFTVSGLAFLSGTVGGSGAVTNEDAEVQSGTLAGREAGLQHIRCLHWGLNPQGTLNDVW